MGSQFKTRVERLENAATPGQEAWPEGFKQHKLNRLLELRAVIHAMRSERETRDPLLAWVTAHERGLLS
jgi:hypothetical protein